MATFTLADLKNEVSKKYASTFIENGDDVYELPNLFQLDSETRHKVEELLEKDDDDSDENGTDRELNRIKDVVAAITVDGKGAELLELIGDNPAMLVELFHAWNDGAQVGEA